MVHSNMQQSSKYIRSLSGMQVCKHKRYPPQNKNSLLNHKIHAVPIVADYILFVRAVS